MISRAVPRTLFVLTILAQPAAAAAAFQVPGSAEITRPTSGQTISGLVTVEGTADHPEFVRYDLAFAYAEDPTPTWFIIAEAVEAPVHAGRLGIWDTTGITEGEYDLRLRVWTSAAEPFVAYVRDLRVSQSAPTSTATAFPSPTMPTPLLTATMAAAPVTPVPTSLAPSAQPRVGGADRAFTIGAGVGASALGALAAYGWIRGRLRAARSSSQRRPRTSSRRRGGPARR
ncbi:MAG: hypothetical protein ACRDG5_00285 [Anaerolineales bacterium]